MGFLAPTLTSEEVDLAERVACSLRRRARLKVLEQPSLAVPRLGFNLVEEYLGRGIRGLSVNGDRTIRVAPEKYAPRRELTIAHELMEMALPRQIRRGERRERICQRGAAAFILPSVAFHQAFRRARGDLALLRRWHRWASWEAIGRRVVDIFPGSGFTVWADSAARRIGLGTALDPAEAEAIQRVIASGGRVLVPGRTGVAIAWRNMDTFSESCAVCLFIAEGLYRSLGSDGMSSSM